MEDSKLKLVLLGSNSVGKTSLVTNSTEGKYIQTIEDIYPKSFTIDGEMYHLDILDIGGGEDNVTVREQSIEQGQGYMLVYDITLKSSFDDIQSFYDEILRVTEEKKPMILVGNKSDLESKRKVSQEEGKALARRYDCPFFETSVKNGSNVDACFFTLVRLVIADYLAAALGSPNLPTTSQNAQKKGGKKFKLPNLTQFSHKPISHFKAVSLE